MSIIIDFEDIPSGQPIFSQYQSKGVLFPTKPIIFKPKAGTQSGTQALISAPLSEEFNPGPLTIIFTAPQKYVKMFVGLAEGVACETKVALRAFDKNQGGNLVTQSEVTLGPDPTAVTEPIKVEAQSANILRVELEYSKANFEVIDDLQFDNVGPEPEQDNVKPIVEIIVPEYNKSFTLNYPQIFLKFKIIEDHLKRVTVRIERTNLGAETKTEFNVCGDGTSSCVGTPPNFEFGFYTDAFYGDNEIIITAEDFAGNIGFDTTKFTILPVNPREVGVEWVINYSLVGKHNVPGRKPCAEGFYEVLFNQPGWFGKFNNGNTNARERHFKSKSKGGEDDQWIDSVDFAYFAGHGAGAGTIAGDTGAGRGGGFTFGINMFDDWVLKCIPGNLEPKWGDQNLKWIVLDCCSALAVKHEVGVSPPKIAEDSEGVEYELWERWQHPDVMRGIHFILGFRTYGTDSSYRGRIFAEYLTGKRDGKCYTIWQAWMKATRDTEYDEVKGAYLCDESPGADTKNDHLYGCGYVSKNPEPNNRTRSYQSWSV